MSDEKRATITSVKKATEEARARVIEAIRTQSKRDHFSLSEAQWRLLNDREENALTMAELGPLLERIEDEEDNVLELLFRYEQSLPHQEKQAFRESVTLAADRKEYLGGLLTGVEFDELKPELSRGADILLLFATAMGIVTVAIFLIVFVPPIDSEQLPRWVRDIPARYRFWSETAFGTWFGLIVIFGLLAYALSFFWTTVWQRLQSSRKNGARDRWNEP